MLGVGLAAALSFVPLRKALRRRGETVRVLDIGDVEIYSGATLLDTLDVLVGDATMSPYEITYPGGSVEHWNEEPGAIWLHRLVQTYEHLVWLNPVPRAHWDHTQSVELVREIIGPQRMFPLTLQGLDDAMRELSR